MSNPARIRYANDNVFSDGATRQMATVSGTAAQGYSAALTVGVSL